MRGTRRVGMTSLTCRRAALLALCGAVAAPASQAQTYPARVVRYVIPGGAGAGTDIIGRIIAAGLTRVFGQQVIVDNRPGAGGNIGAELAAKAPPDGYTVLQISITHAVNVSLYRSLRYDVVRDFAAVTQLASAPAIIVVHPSLPAKSVADLVKLAKARPGVINYASAGTGTPTFLAAELFKAIAGIDLVHVPYKGGAEAQTSAIAGETSVYFASFATALPFVRQGRLRALAVTSVKRVPQLAEYLTVAESGYPDYQAGNWYGLLVPARTPKETIAAIHAAIVAVLGNPGVQKQLSDQGFITVGDQPEEFGAFLRFEIATLTKVVRNLGLRAD
jgi:tripartite-type tricarboxylate transporter receptor subunit TctC